MRLAVYDQATLDRCVAALRAAVDTGKRWRVEIARLRPPRSNAQNARMWAAYEHIQASVMQSHGELVPTEEIHETLKRRILGMRESPIGMLPASTTELDTEAMSSYVEHCMRIAAQDWGVEWSGWEDA